MAGRLALAMSCLLPQAARADMIFHVSETIVEEEVRPQTAHHVTRWQGDYYVTDRDVSVLGWGTKGGGAPIAFDVVQVQSRPGVGTDHTTLFHRIPDGIDVLMTYESFIVERRVVQTGPQSCAMTVTTALRPGHTVFEVHRIRNHEPMADATRRFVDVGCTVPKLVS